MAIVAVEELLLPQHLDLNRLNSKTFHARVGIIVRGCRSIIPRPVVPIENTCAHKMTGLSRKIWVSADKTTDLANQALRVHQLYLLLIGTRSPRADVFYTIRGRLPWPWTGWGHFILQHVEEE